MNTAIWELNIGPTGSVNVKSTQELFRNAIQELNSKIKELEEKSYFIVQVLPISTYNCEAQMGTLKGTISIVIQALIVYR